MRMPLMSSHNSIEKYSSMLLRHHLKHKNKKHFKNEPDVYVTLFIACNVKIDKVGILYH